MGGPHLLVALPSLLLGDGESYCGGAVQVELDEVLGPFRGDPKAGPSHLEGRFAYAVECAAYVPGGDEAGCVGFFSLFQGVKEE